MKGEGDDIYAYASPLRTTTTSSVRRRRASQGGAGGWARSQAPGSGVREVKQLRKYLVHTYVSTYLYVCT